MGWLGSAVRCVLLSGIGRSLHRDPQDGFAQVSKALVSNQVFAESVQISPQIAGREFSSCRSRYLKDLGEERRSENGRDTRKTTAYAEYEECAQFCRG